MIFNCSPSEFKIISEFTVTTQIGDTPTGEYLVTDSLNIKGGYGVGVSVSENTLQIGIDEATFPENLKGKLGENAVRDVLGYVTPQMFGAVGDGITDDTEAIQRALNTGGNIYFPAGRYKATSKLVADKSCRIEMFKPYASSYKREYPLTDEDNWMGCRIETYATDIGMVIGDGVEVDGLFIRAMEGFQGTVLKYDNSLGVPSYPSNVRLSHIKLEVDMCETIPDCMFDFAPNGSYFYLLDDIVIGRNPEKGYCVYGFKADVSTAEKGWSNSTVNWANHVVIRNMCIDLYADYPLYLNGADCGHSWLFDTLAIQTYGSSAYSLSNSYNVSQRTGHENIMVLKNLHLLTFINVHLYDTPMAYINKDVISKSMLNRVVCVGCSDELYAIENELKGIVKDNLDITNLELTIAENTEGTEHIVRLSDGSNQKIASIPITEPTDEQISAGVSAWMDENATPKEVAGKNKFDTSAEQCVVGVYNASGQFVPSQTGFYVTDYIPIKQYDIVRTSIGGQVANPYYVVVFDSTKTLLERTGPFGMNEIKTGILVDNEGAGYIRCCLHEAQYGTYDERFDKNICITINNGDITYEPFGTHLEGGIGSFMVLRSPNGTQYTLSVSDDGVLSATAKE